MIFHQGERQTIFDVELFEKQDHSSFHHKLIYFQENLRCNPLDMALA